MRVSLASKSVFCVRENYLRNDVAVYFDLSERIRISAAVGSQIHPSCFSTSGTVFLHYVFRSDANAPGVHQRLQFFRVARTLAVRHHARGKIRRNGAAPAATIERGSRSKARKESSQPKLFLVGGGELAEL